MANETKSDRSIPSTPRADQPAPASFTVQGERTLLIERSFRAPPRVVFEAWTNPELVARWWAPRSRCVEIVRCDADGRVGGAYRYVLRAEGREPFAFSGVYQEIVAPTRLVYTQIFEPMAHAGAVVVTATFTEREGRTDLRSEEVYPSQEALEAALAAGMEHGARETLDLLDELVVTLA
jgi:uncharacterized protein YndB with AHSA1/START domain